MLHAPILNMFFFSFFYPFIVYYYLYILYANYSSEIVYFLERYFDLIRVICFKHPCILRIINLLTTNRAYLLYKG